MVLRITQAQAEAIRGHGARDYPSECCGALLGKVEGESKRVMEVAALKNLRHDPGQAQQLLPVDDLARETERNRFLIDPLAQLRMEKDARSRGLDVLGYYHSHPDHPARPSVYDREHAWPWYSYLIVSVEQGMARDLTCWVLAEDGAIFDPESVEVVEYDRA